MIPWALSGIEVANISRRKQIVLINAGRADGLIQGTKVCIFDGSRKISCGAIIAVSEHAAKVKVRDGLLEIKKGFEVRKVTKDDLPGRETSDGFQLRLLTTPVVSGSPLEYQVLTYIGAQEEATLPSLWDARRSYSERASSGISYSIGLEAERSWMRLGLRMREYQILRGRADYSLSAAQLVLDTEQSAKAMGLTLDGSLPIADGWLLGLGLDFDQHTVAVQSRLVDTTVEEPVQTLYDLNTKAMIVALRVPLRYQLFLHPMGMSFGITPSLPLALVGQSTTLRSEDGANAPKVVDAESNLIEALNVRPGGFYLEAAFGLYATW